MKLKKKITALLTASLIVATQLFAFGTNVFADQQIKVYVNQVPVDFGGDEPQIIKGNAMVPVRGFSEALGLRVNWNEENKKVTLIWSEGYAILEVGNKTMMYGRLGEQLSKEEVETMYKLDLESPPVIVDGKTLFPAIAIATAMEADVSWDEETTSVYIETKRFEELAKYGQQQQDVIDISPVQESIENDYSVSVEKTAYFQNINFNYAKVLYESEIKYALVLYKSEDPNYIEKLAPIMEAAESTEFKVFALDLNSPEFSLKDAMWAKNYVVRDNPVIIMSYEVNGTKTLEDVSNKEDVENALINLRENNFDGDSFMINEPQIIFEEQQPLQSISYENDSNESITNANTWQEITEKQAKDKYVNGDKFIYIPYDEKGGEEYNLAILDIKQAAKNTGTTIYYTTLQKEGGLIDIGNSHAGIGPTKPTILLVRGREEIIYTITPANQQDFEKYILDFFRQ